MKELELKAALEVEEKVGSDPNQTREQYILEVAQDGYIPTYPKPNELFLDIDNQGQWETFLRNWEVLVRNLENNHICDYDEDGNEVKMTYTVTPSRSGNKHIRIKMPWFLGHMDRIAWQASLGSDPVRELLGCIRCACGDKEPTMLVEKDPNWKGPIKEDI